MPNYGQRGSEDHSQTRGQQMTFIKGRDIMHAILTANDCVERRQKPKARYHMQTGYPENIWSLELELSHSHAAKKGFGTRWMMWTKHCISTMSFSVLINRTPNVFFSSQRGQTDREIPCPFPVCLAMEGMSIILLRWCFSFLWSWGGTSSDAEGDIHHFLSSVQAPH